MIRYQLSEQEVVQGQLKYRKRPSSLLGISLILVCSVLMFLCGYLLPAGQKQEYYILGSLFLVVAIVVWLLIPTILRRGFLKIVRANPVFTETKEVTFGKNGIVFSSAVQRNEIAWSAFKRLTEDERYYYLRVDDLGNVAMLPKLAFDAETLDQFQQHSQSVPRA